MQVALFRAPALPRAAAARGAAKGGRLHPALAPVPAAAAPPAARALAAAKPKPGRSTLAVRAAASTEQAELGAHGGDSAADVVPTLSPAAEAVAGLRSLPDLWPWLAAQHGDAPAVEDRHRTPHVSHTFQQLAGEVQAFGAGLAATGVRPDDRVALFSESSGRWVIADQGIMSAGAVDAVRGTLSISTEELSFILRSAEAAAVVVQDAATLERLLPQLPDACRLAVVLWGEVPHQAVERSNRQLAAQTYDELTARGRQALRGGWAPPARAPEDLASLMFTSGTSGKPKGVPVTHSNMLSQLVDLDFLPTQPGDVSVSYLPAWHAYGRTLDYYLLSRGVKLFYSTLMGLKGDLAEQQPHIFVSVPLMLDVLHSKAQQLLRQQDGQAQLVDAALRLVRVRRVREGTALGYALTPPSEAEVAAAARQGAELEAQRTEADESALAGLRAALGFGRTRWVVSGGGSLTPQLDDFYEAIGVPTVVGYGLTETSPVLTVRRLEGNVRGTIGPPIPRTQLRIVDPSDPARELPDGQQGLILAKGPQVLAGYWRNPEATAKAFPLGLDSGWFDTGDLGWRVPRGVPGSRMGGNIVIAGGLYCKDGLQYKGRQKDTIVLTGGENVEPSPLEDLLCTSPHIAFAVLVGHGRRSVGVLLFPTPEALEAAGGDGADPDLRRLLEGEVARTLKDRAPHERVRAFAVVPEPLSVEGGTLTRTMKPRRAEVFSKYRQQVAEVEAQLR